MLIWIIIIQDLQREYEVIYPPPKPPTPDMPYPETDAELSATQPSTEDGQLGQYNLMDN